MSQAKVRQNPETKLYELVENGIVLESSPNPEDFRVPERRQSGPRSSRPHGSRPRNWRQDLLEALSLFPDSSAADIATLFSLSLSIVHRMLHDLEAEGVVKSTVIGGGRYRHIRRWRLA